MPERPRRLPAPPRLSGRLALPGGCLVGLLDTVVVLWIALWIVLALAIASEMRNLGRLSMTVERVGVAAVRVGDGLAALASVPLVGDRVARAGDEVRAAGRRATLGARQSDRSADRLSVLLGLSIALLPTAPLLVYVPLRVARAREARTLRRALAAGGDAEGLERFLAERAAANLSYAQLRRVSEAPWRDLEEGRYGALAQAELGRLGVRPPPRFRRPGGGSGTLILSGGACGAAGRDPRCGGSRLVSAAAAAPRSRA